MTDLTDGLLACLLVGVLNIFIMRAFSARVPATEVPFLRSVYLWTLLLRGALALFLNVYSGNSRFADMFWGDSATYDVRGYLLSLYWSGETLTNLDIEGSVSGWGFYYFVALFYYMLGRNQLLIQLLNATMGSLTVIVIYALATRLFDARAARWAALFMAFFPQMLFWSAAMYKDTAIMLCLAVSMYAVQRLSREFSLGWVIVFVATALCLMTLRFYVFYMVAFATLGTFVFSQRRGLVGRLASQVFLLLAFLGAFSFAASRETVERQAEYFDLRRVQVTRSDQAALGESAFDKRVDVSTTSGALSAMPVGLVNLLFAPFPWSVTSLRQVLTLPETLVWYALMPAFVRGLVYTIRHKLRDALPILAFAIMLTSAYAVFQGNVGTAYRQRTQVTMFFFIFMGVGIVEKQRRSELVQARAQMFAHQTAR